MTRLASLGAAAMSLLAGNFNRLLGISEGHFGRATKSEVLGEGAQRAKARLEAHRQAQVDRLNNASTAPMTRQQKRQMKRRADKMPIGMKQSDWHRINGFAKIGRGR